MEPSFRLMGLVNDGVTLLELALAAAALIACLVYRRASSAMPLLILGFLGFVVSLVGFLLLAFVHQFLMDFELDRMGMINLLLRLLNLAAWGLIAVGLFQVLGDVVRRLDRSRTDRPDDDYGRRRPARDRGDDPLWEARPGGSDIQR